MEKEYDAYLAVTLNGDDIEIRQKQAARRKAELEAKKADTTKKQ